MYNLSTDDMVVVADVFQSSFEHTLSNYTKESRETILPFVANVILREKPYALVTPEGVQHAMGLVFGKEAYRDFIMTLTFTFLSRLGHGEEFVQGLASNLARGASLGGSGDLNATPDPIRERLPTVQLVKDLLAQSPWMMTLLLLQLFIVADTGTQPKKQPSSQQ